MSTPAVLASGSIKPLRVQNDGSRLESAWGLVVAAVLTTAASIGLYGYSLGLHNHSIQIPHLRSLQDPSLFPGDRLVEAMQGYFSLFWPFMAWLTDRLPLEFTFFAGHVAATAATYVAVLAITRRVFPDEPAAPYLGLWLTLWGKAVLDQESLHWAYFTHTPVANLVGLWAIYFAVADRWMLAMFLAGIVFDLQAMQSFYLFLMFSVAAGVEFRRAAGQIAAAFLLYLLAALPGIVWMVRSSALGSPDDLPDLLRAFFPAHFFPSSLSANGLAGMAVMLLFAGTSWAVLPAVPPVRRVLLMCAAVVGLSVVGAVSAEWWPSGLVLKLHVFRASAFLCHLVFILIGGYLAISWRRRSSGWTRPLVLAVLLAMSMDSTKRWIVVTCLLLLLWLDRGIILSSTRYQNSASAVILLCLGAWVAVSQVRRTVETREYLAKQNLWFDVQRWAGAHSDPADVFLTPPDCEGFRVFSERPVVGEWKDGAAVLWDKSYADYWRHWYLSLGGGFERNPRQSISVRLARAWYTMGQTRIEFLARTLGARYIVLRRPNDRERAGGLRLDWNGPVLYENTRFFVVRVPPA